MAVDVGQNGVTIVRYVDIESDTYLPEYNSHFIFVYIERKNHPSMASSSSSDCAAAGGGTSSFGISFEIC